MNVAELLRYVPDILLLLIPGYIVLKIREDYGWEKKLGNMETVLLSILYSFIVGIIFALILSVARRLFPAAAIWISGEVVRRAFFLIIAAFYGGCYLLRNHVNEKFQKVLFFIENVSFPYYLVHVHFGMISMYYLKQLGVNSYINVVCATIVSAVVAVLVTKLVTYIEGMSWYRKIGAKWTT